MINDAENKYPEMNSHPIKMDDANQNIIIHSGIFTLKTNNKVMTLNGTISFDWFPKINVRFKGVLIESELTTTLSPMSLFIKDQKIGEGFLTGTKIASETLLEGILSDKVIIGDSTIPVSSVRFVLPNFNNFHGLPVKQTLNNKVIQCRSRLVFSNQNYLIIIDCLPDYNKLKEKLLNQGGYIIQYIGQITKLKGPIYHDEIEIITEGFSIFLSFLNGRRCGALFNQGIHENDVVWTDFTPKKMDIFKSVFSWSLYEDTSGFNNLWINFCNLWSDASDRHFLKSVIHWYLEANKNSAYLEGSIIMTQIGLELIYNWYIIEKKKLIINEDSESISASNKIRLLISQINLTSEIPHSLKALELYIKSNSLPDGIEAFVQIRNALVHSQEKKREKLEKIAENVLSEALGLGLWYLELSILRVLDFDGKYLSRCSSDPLTGTNILKVPWTKT